VPKLLEHLVAAEEEVNYETDDNDPTRILLGYEKAWWDEEAPVPVPILEVRKLTDSLDFQNCLVSVFLGMLAIEPERHAIYRKSRMNKIPWMRTMSHYRR
jgi:hypothetical protein